MFSAWVCGGGHSQSSRNLERISCFAARTAASLVLFVEDLFVGFVRASVAVNGFVASWKPLMGFSVRSLVRLVAEREGRLSAGKSCISGVSGEGEGEYRQVTWMCTIGR